MNDLTELRNIPRLTTLSHGGGSGCKIAPAVLPQIISKADISILLKQLPVGIETADDAAVDQINESKAMVAATDFFMPIVDDPYDFSRSAATNAISDAYAMSGTPINTLPMGNHQENSRRRRIDLQADSRTPALQVG